MVPRRAWCACGNALPFRQVLVLHFLWRGRGRLGRFPFRLRPALVGRLGKIGSAPAVVGELVVYQSATGKYCVLAYHPGSTVGVALPSPVRVTSPTGAKVLDSGTYQQ
jgi:hypothetical protein